MSIKDLFDKGHSLKFVKNKTKNDLASGVESYRYIDVYSKNKERFIPDVDFTTASNFARFGLAEEYYSTAIKRIYQTYPYDGSQAEKIEWENDSTYLDLFIFENEYPRTNGFINFNSSSHTYTVSSVNSIFSSSAPEYIRFFGGPHADPGGDFKKDIEAGPNKVGTSKANIYDTDLGRGNNLEINLDDGVTIEFWLRKTGWASTSANKDEYVFHNSYSGSVLSEYAGLRVRTRGKTDQDHQMSLIVESGSVSMTFNHDTKLNTSVGIADQSWHHYAVTAKTVGTGTVSNLYVDGVHKSSITNSTTKINSVTGTMKGALGALANSVSSSALGYHAAAGWGNITFAQIDEFRYWKTERSAEEIGRFFIDQVGGGTNTDNVKYSDVTNKVNLGVYYKFNEGITGDPSIDKKVLDYSGRISNGTYINYNSSLTRNTGSAIVLAGAAIKEFKDPIIYGTHPDVSNLLTNKTISGSAHDYENASSLYKSVPAWILEDDEQNSNNLKYLTQIIGSFFDDMYMQIEKLPSLKNVNYADEAFYEKPLPFAERLLESRGYAAPELFADVSDLAKYLNRDEKKLFENKLHEVKNTIYQNIYNNLAFIQKSKGTEKSLRNFLRCFGVDEELIKLNIYSNNETFELKDRTTNTSITKRYIDFDDIDTRLTSSDSLEEVYGANVYQYYTPGDSNSLSYIPGASGANSVLSGAMFTLETEVFFPKRNIVNDLREATFPNLTSSIFGLHAVTSSNTDLTFNVNNNMNFNVAVIKDSNNNRAAKFALLSSAGTPIFSEVSNDSSFLDIYNNEKWNLAFRLRPTKAPTDESFQLNTSVGYLEPAASAYTYELYGVNYASDIIQDEFTLSGTISLAQAEEFFSKPKRVFVGANRVNFTGSISAHSDVKISSTRAWLDYLTNDVIRSHARDASSYGTLSPYKNYLNSLNTNYAPQISSLILNWTFENITGSNASGQFLVNDFASGSTNERHKIGDDWSKSISRHNYSGRGDNFITDTSFLDHVVDIEFIPTAKLKLPEVVGSDDMVKILNKQDDVVFTRDTTYVQHLLSVEKSMYQIISEDMLKLFASINNFNNLIGDPVNRYRPNYKELEKIRHYFFESVENELLDLEKFIQYFKWIDDAVTIMIADLIPVSSNSTDFLRNMVESHILERSKYFNKFPTLETKPHNPISSLKGIEELKYNWRLGHAPLNPDEKTNQNQNCLWWKDRAERSDVLSSGDTTIDDAKTDILRIITSDVTGTAPTLKTSAGARYSSTYYYNRSLARPVDVSTARSLKLKGGANSSDNRLVSDFYKTVIKWASDDDFIYLDIDNRSTPADCDDRVKPDELTKEKFRFKALVMPANETNDSNAEGTGANDLQYTDAKSNMILPFTIFSSSVNSGYQKIYSDQFGLEFTDLHSDKYGYDSEIPMQGPFTEKHVGGSQHRHVKLNRGSDNQFNRPEAWHLQEFLDQVGYTDYVFQEYFKNATSTAQTDGKILGLPSGSIVGEPSGFEYWRNAVNAENPWTFFSGSTPSAGTGPSSGQLDDATGYAYCEVLPSKVGQSFAFSTPLIDFLDLDEGSVAQFVFYYHMHGSGVGTLKVQASSDPNFVSDVEDLVVAWGTGASSFRARSISGQQHSAPGATWTIARISSTGFGNGLINWLGKRFYIRFLYTAGPSHLGDVAVDSVVLFKSSSGALQDSFKLLHPTYDDHNRPYATYTRDTIAKRPINVRNIHMTGNSPTSAGNFLERYEYVSTMSPEANDPFFVKNVDNFSQNHKLRYSRVQMSEALKSIERKTDGAFPNRNVPTHPEYTLLDRTFLTGTIRNRTRIKTRFSSPGGLETMSRGFLDPEHETFSPNNAMTFRNLGQRRIYNTQLQAHQGQYGVSTHDTTRARVYGSETTGAINALDYTITGDASAHKYHRNSAERASRAPVNAFVGGQNVGVVSLTPTKHYAQFDHSDDYRLTGSVNNPLYLDTFTIAAWINYDSDMSGLTSAAAENTAKGQSGRVCGIVQLSSAGQVIANQDYRPDSGYRAFVISGSNPDSSRKIGFLSKFGHGTDAAGLAGDEGPGVWFSTSSSDSSADGLISAGQWHHVAMSISQASGSHASSSADPVFYIDGQKVGTYERFSPSGSYIATAHLADTVAASNTHLIGVSDLAPLDLAMIESNGFSDDYESRRRFKGRMAEVGIWSSVLTDLQVAQLSVVNTSGETCNFLSHSAASDLVSWYRFGDSTRDHEQGALSKFYLFNAASAPDTEENTAINAHADSSSFGATSALVPTLLTSSIYGGSDTVSGTLGAVAKGIAIAAEEKTMFNNAYVSHMIPRTDNQIRWITGSIN